MHPVHNLCAFVEYDDEIGEIWTSIAGDPEAPFRLALENRQLRSLGKRIHTCSVGTADSDRRRKQNSESHAQPESCMNPQVKSDCNLRT
jgi:hypothetical protein